jgi:hypothetical protein
MVFFFSFLFFFIRLKCDDSSTVCHAALMQVGNISKWEVYPIHALMQVGNISKWEVYPIQYIYIDRYIQSSNQMNFLVEIKFNVSESIIHHKFLTD